MTAADALLELFAQAARAVRDAVGSIPAADLRRRTERRGQYALDLVADAVALPVLARAGAHIVSEESGRHEQAGAALTVVVDPVDGSTNCSRGIPYWATSICALDAAGPLAGLVVNQATGVCVTAVRGEGAFRDGVRVTASPVRAAEDAVVYLTGPPPLAARWKQYRALGSAALGLCEIATGSFDGYLDTGSYHAPWDYLAGVLACTESGAVVRDLRGRALATPDTDARRQLVAAGTPALAAALVAMTGGGPA